MQLPNGAIYTDGLMLQVMSQSTALFMDGTFKAAPRLFTQLYSIHALYRDHVVPVIYYLLPNKLRATYHDVVDILKRVMATYRLLLNPQTIMSDYESGKPRCVSVINLPILCPV